MKKIIIVLIIITAASLYLYGNRAYWIMKPIISNLGPQGLKCKADLDQLLSESLQLLKSRKDDAALANFTKMLANNPDDVSALWGKAEVLRRKRNYAEAEALFDKVISFNPGYAPALISLSYIRYANDKLNEAQALINDALNRCFDKDNEALAYTMLGSINGRRAAKGGIFCKIKYGTQVKCYFLHAKELAPDLPEVHLALGTFYLLAPSIVGGNLDKAIEELDAAVKLAPDFATANARLAQAYKKKGNFDKYNFYIQYIKELDPENEVLKEIHE